MIRMESSCARFGVVAFAVVMLTACGGGGDSISSDDPSAVDLNSYQVSKAKPDWKGQKPGHGYSKPNGGHASKPFLQPEPEPAPEPAPEPLTKDISLSWTAPESRTDGTSVTLSEIGGYKVYVGTASNSYGPPIDAGDTTTYTLFSMSADTYYITISAYDTDGIESAKSTEFAVTIQ